MPRHREGATEGPRIVDHGKCAEDVAVVIVVAEVDVGEEASQHPAGDMKTPLHDAVYVGVLHTPGACQKTPSARVA